MKYEIVRRVALTFVAATAAAAVAPFRTFCNPMPNLPVERPDLELSVADDGRPVFGNGRLSVVFDAATGFPAEYRRGETVLLSSDPAWPDPVAFGCEQPWNDRKNAFRGSKKVGDVVRIASDEVKTALRTGYWLGDHQKTLPAQTAPGLGFDCTFKVVR